MRGVLELVDFFHLKFDVGVDEVVAEDVALLKEVAILGEVLESLTQGAADLGNVLQFFGRQIIEVLVHGIAGVNLVGDAVKTRHQHG